MIPLSASKVWLEVQRDGGIWSFQTWTKKSFIASPASGNESWGGGRDLSDSPRKSIFLSPWIGRCRTKVDVIRSWSPPRSLIRPSLSHWVFLSRFLMRPSCPTLQSLRPVRHLSKFSPRTKRILGTIQVRLSFQIDGFLTGLPQR